MEMREEHSGLNFITRGGASPQGKPKVYFCATEKDQGRFFEEICADIFKYRPECAIFYKGENDPGFTEARQEVLAEMQLFVMPVTTELLTKENPALSQEYPFAQENKIPVLPLMEEQDLEDIFNFKCGELQFLDKNAKDDTAISYEDKLKKFLEAVLIGDEMAKKIRAAFDAYIFLSYRKKDRKQAQDLMRLIHENEDFQDIAIWYDEFLVPGENFNQAIGEALQKCDVFTLLVTPNLINEPNYVQQQEYPAAVASQKPVLPVEAQETDRSALEKQYPEIPICAAPEAGQLSEEMHARLTKIALGENNSDPMHLFFMGLAYLGGIDVERNPERAERLLKKSADLGLPEACEKLSQMYNTGDGVERNYETAALWLEKQAQLLKEIWEKEQTEEAGDRYFVCLYDLGDAWNDLSRLGKAQKVFETMVTLARQLLQKDSRNRNFQNQYGIACGRLGNIATANGKLQEAEDWYRKDLEIAQTLVEEVGTAETRRNLAIACRNVGNTAQAYGKLQEAEDWYRRDLEISKALAEETGTQQDRRGLAVSYEKMGGIAKANWKLQEAEGWYRKDLEISKALAEETGTQQDRMKLAVSYEKMGGIAEASGKLQEAENWYCRILELIKAMVEETGTLQDRRGLAVSYVKLGDLAMANEKPQEAETWYRKDLDISRALAEETGTFLARRDLAACYERMGYIAQLNWRLQEAQDWYLKFLEIYRALAEETGTVQDRRNLAYSYSKMGDIAEVGGKTQETEDWYRKGLEIYRALAEETGTLDARRDLAVSYYKMGEIAKVNGKTQEAEDWHRKDLEISKALAEETGTAVARRDLAGSYYKMGSITYINGKLREAEDWYRKFLDIMKALEEETRTLEHREILAIAYGRMGDIAKAQGKFPEAENWYLKKVEVAQALAEETETVKHRRDLAVSYYMASTADHALKKHTKEIGLLQKAISLLKALVKETGDPESARILEKMAEIAVGPKSQPGFFSRLFGRKRK